MTIQLDTRQKDLIDAWIGIANTPGTNDYMAFMSLWIAFNAYCYAAYVNDAVKEQVYIGEHRGLKDLPETPCVVLGEIHAQPDHTKVKLKVPGRIDLTIKLRYTENLIFDRFASDEANINLYKRMLIEGGFLSEVTELKDQLSKGEFHYVINMARIKDYPPETRSLDQVGYKRLVNAGIVVPFADVEDLIELRHALYQIRCNVFHGGKVPGDISDDKIVKASVPVLKKLLDMVLRQTC